MYAIFPTDRFTVLGLVQDLFKTNWKFQATKQGKAMEASKFASLISIALIIKRSRTRRRRLLCTKEWLKRNERGVFCQLIKELRLEDPEHYRRYLRMDTPTFEVCCLCDVTLSL